MTGSISDAVAASGDSTTMRTEGGATSYQTMEIVPKEDDNQEQQEAAGAPSKEGDKWGRVKKIVLGLLLLGIISFVIADSLTNQHIRNGFQQFLEWVERNPAAGVFAFMGVYFLATVLFLPGSILTLGSGFVFANAFGLGFGVALATLAVFVGASTGAIVAFILGRYLLRDWVMTLTQKYPIFGAIDKALEEKGFRIMVLLRLSPIIPFNALNYIAGVTAVSLPAYCWSLFGIFPGTTLYVFLGATAGSLTDSASSGGTSVTQIVVIVCGAVFGIIGIAATSYYAKKELNKITTDGNGEEAAAKVGEGVAANTEEPVSEEQAATDEMMDRV